MNELTVITMTWWQLALFTGAIFFYGAFANEFLPRFLKRLIDRLESKDKEVKKL